LRRALLQLRRTAQVQGEIPARVAVPLPRGAGGCRAAKDPARRIAAHFGRCDASGDPARRCRAVRLLLTEDDAMIGEAVQRGLRQLGFALDWVRDGAAAEQALALEPYDLLLLDLGLPRKSGVELLRDLRRRGAGIPVVILTARDAMTDRVAGRDAGAGEHVG